MFTNAVKRLVKTVILRGKAALFLVVRS